MAKKTKNNPEDSSSQSFQIKKDDNGNEYPLCLDIDQNKFLKPCQGFTQNGNWYYVVSSREDNSIWVHMVVTDNHQIEGFMGKESKSYSFDFEPCSVPSRWSNGSIKKYTRRASEFSSPKEVFNDIRKIYDDHCQFTDPEISAILSLFTMLTYVHRCVYALPIIYLTGDPGTGKSRTSDIMTNLCYNANKGDYSVAGLRRDIAAYAPTIIIDDAEFLNPKQPSEKSQYTQFILRRNYKKGNIDKMRDKDDPKKEEFFELFCPSVISCVTYLEQALDTRTIEIRMIYSEDGRVNRDLPREDMPIWQDIRDKCYIFGLDYARKYREIYDGIESPDFMKGRNFEIWRPLVALAKLVGDDVLEEIMRISKDFIEDRYMERIPIVRQSIIAVLVDKMKQSQQSIDGWKGSVEMPFTSLAHLTEEKMDSLGVTPQYKMTPKKVGWVLREMGFRKGKGIKLLDGRNYLDISSDDVKALCEKYTKAANMDVGL